jgi:N-acetylmuramic acid 6-phosphate etherase
VSPGDPPTKDPGHLDDLVTEGRPSPPKDYESLSTAELVELMNREDAAVPGAVGAIARELAQVVDAVVAKLGTGGRLIYVGAGTSGALAAVDAEECESTFSTAPGQVVALVAGAGFGAGPARDAAEDDARAGSDAIRSIEVSQRDAVIGISASGRTPYVIGALETAAATAALTACVVSVPNSELARICEHELAVVVGPEFVAGSTRLKAGTAQKLVLNTISTLSMIRLGKTYGDLMVDVAGTNEKLRARAREAVLQATGASGDEVDAALEAADGSAKVAIVSLLGDVDTDAARAALERSSGNIRAALAEVRA